MNSRTVGGVHWSFWVIGAIALIWNVLGVVNFFTQLSADAVAAMPEAYRALIENRAVWATGAFAVAVIGGALGCLLLLLKKSASYYVFIASLLGVIVTMIHAIGVNAAFVGLGRVLIGTSTSLVVAIFLVWYSKRAERLGWVN